LKLVLVDTLGRFAALSSLSSQEPLESGLPRRIEVSSVTRVYRGHLAELLPVVVLVVAAEVLQIKR